MFTKVHQAKALRTIQYSTMRQADYSMSNHNAPKIKTQNKLGIFALAVLAIAACAYIFTNEVHAQSVYSVCNQARLENTISEGTCSDMQIKYHYEYICEHNNNLTTNHCHVERNELLNDN